MGAGRPGLLAGGERQESVASCDELVGGGVEPSPSGRRRRDHYPDA